MIDLCEDMITPIDFIKKTTKGETVTPSAGDEEIVAKLIALGVKKAKEYEDHEQFDCCNSELELSNEQKFAEHESRAKTRSQQLPALAGTAIRMATASPPSRK